MSENTKPDEPKEPNNSSTDLKSQEDNLWRPKRLSNRSKIKKPVIFAVGFGLIGIVFFLAIHASPSPYDDIKQSSLVDDPSRGLVYKGLRAVKADAQHDCKGQFEVEDIKVDNQPLCTHGPDAAPVGVDVTKVNVYQQLDKGKKQSANFVKEADLQTLIKDKFNDTNSGSFSNTYPLSSVPCTSGNFRIQLMLVSNIPINPYTTIAKNLLIQTAHRVETQLEVSAIYSGVGATNKHFRFVTNSSCQPLVKTIIVPSSTSLKNSEDVDRVLINKGYTNKYTKYVTWVYANVVNYCSTANREGDSSSLASTNKSNTKTGYAEIGPACWGSTSELHEIMHLLGAVQNDAPHSSGGGHCIDLHDIMCYADGNLSAGLAANGKKVYVDSHCSKIGFQWLLDCNRDDYFSTSAYAYVDPSRYLYWHWNVANSPYLR